MGTVETAALAYAHRPADHSDDRVGQHAQADVYSDDHPKALRGRHDALPPVQPGGNDVAHAGMACAFLSGPGYQQERRSPLWLGLPNVARQPAASRLNLIAGSGCTALGRAVTACGDESVSADQRRRGRMAHGQRIQGAERGGGLPRLSRLTRLPACSDLPPWPRDHRPTYGQHRRQVAGDHGYGVAGQDLPSEPAQACAPPGQRQIASR